MSSVIHRLNEALHGRYRIERELGEGGMAMVYLAVDVRHDRNVALKILKPELAAAMGADRFLAEIRTTAHLQHPNILTLHDSGEADGFLYFVTPFVEGESLRARLDREKQLPVDDAVRIASEVADALQAAHERGVIHRDVKPANILLSRGRPIVADFGIALAVSAAGGDRLTESGVFLGTPHYMSPEQVTGAGDVDARADVYALGCVLYEMLTGQPPHAAATAQAVLGRMLTSDPEPVAAVRRSVPLNVSEAVRKATQRLPADRFVSSQAFREALTNPAFRSALAGPAAPGRGHPARPRVALAGWIVAAAAIALWFLLPRSGADDTPASSPVYATIPLPESAPMATGQATQMAISPDGSMLVYVAQLDSGTQLYRRDLRQREEATPIPGTDGARGVFFSPDGAWIGFTSEPDRVARVPTGGGPVQAVGSGATSVGATWIEGAIVASRQDGTELIVFAEEGGSRVLPLRGGPLFSPSALPGARRVLGRLDDWRLGVAELETGNLFALTRDGLRPYVEAEDVGVTGTSPRYLPTGHVMFTRLDGVLAVVRFDVASLAIAGDVELVGEGVRVSDYTGEAQWALGPDGSLVQAMGAFGLAGRLAFIDEAGVIEELPFEPRVFGAVALAPNGQRIAAQVHPPVDPQEVWVLDLATGTERRMKSGWTYNSLAWWPDSESVIYLETVPGASGDARGRLTRHYLRDMTTTEPIPFTAGPEDVSRDGRWLLATRWDWTDPPPGLWLYDIAADSAVRLRDERTATVARFAPEADWVAWSHVQGSAYQVFVAPLKDGNAGDARLLGTGFSPAWSSDGARLHWYDYPAPIRMMAARPPGFAPQIVAQLDRFLTVHGRDIDVAPDGRFLFVAGADQRPIRELVLITNWSARLTGAN